LVTASTAATIVRTSVRPKADASLAPSDMFAISARAGAA
jgi:hypothetical protein